MQTIEMAPVQAPICRTSTTLVGESVVMQKLRERIAKIARTNARVLIEGESGVGKEVVARSVHGQSERHERVFVAENCAAFSPELLESELFGHARGAFTDARDARSGILKTADQGTVLLDEINTMSPAFQAKILRVLETGTFRPVGADKVTSVDVRFLAAGNKDLRAMVGAGAFREDLYYRLAVVAIRVPPLREHKEDIPEIAAHVLGGRTRISLGAHEVLSRYDWPGNVRELQNVLERAAIFSEAEMIAGAEVEEAITGSRDKIVPTSSGGVVQWPVCDGSGRILTLAEMEREQILGVVQGSLARLEKSAVLGISPKTLYNYLRKYGVKKRFS